MNSSTIQIPISPWAKQTMERLQHIFSPAGDLPADTVEKVFAQIYQTTPKSHINQSSLDSFFLMVACWGLNRVQQTEDLEARRQFGLFVNELQNAQSCLQKAMQMAKTLSLETHTLEVNAVGPVPPTNRVDVLPLASFM